MVGLQFAERLPNRDHFSSEFGQLSSHFSPFSLYEGAVDVTAWSEVGFVIGSLSCVACQPKAKPKRQRQ